MPAPPKKLHEFIRDRTFLARRHEDLLREETIPAQFWPELSKLQGAWRAEPSKLERRAIALRIQRLVRETPAKRLDRVLHEMPIEEDDAQQGDGSLSRILSRQPEPWTPEKDRKARARFAAAVYARDLHDDGLSLAAISREFCASPYFRNASPATVRRYLDELGVPRPRRRR